ncbi:MTH938/NDUFAF3 family protein [bacterium]
MIQNYDFGILTYDNKTYRSDLIITQDKIICPWHRISGHFLQLVDLEIIKNENYDLLIIGQGYSSCMNISQDVFDFFKKINKKIWTGSTIEACKVYNNFYNEKKIIAAFHLTC